MPIFNTVYGGTGWPTPRPTITGFTYDSKNWAYAWSTYWDANCITFKPDGTKVYLVGESKNTVFQFSLGTAWDITTATYDNKSKAISSQTTVVEGIIFADDWLTMWIWWWWNTWYVYKYTLSTAWDVSTANYTNIRSNASFNETASYKIYNNGQYLFTCSRWNKKIYRYTFWTAWDITTLQSSPMEFSLSNVAWHEVVLNPQWTQMFILDRSNKKISIYNLSTAWDLTTATLTWSYSISTPNNTNITAMCIDNDGNSMYLWWYNIWWIYQYNTVF
jgi:hypothetical protein